MLKILYIKNDTKKREVHTYNNTKKLCSNPTQSIKSQIKKINKANLPNGSSRTHIHDIAKNAIIYKTKESICKEICKESICKENCIVSIIEPKRFFKFKRDEGCK